MKKNSLKNLDTFVRKLIFLSVVFLFIWNSSLGQVAPSLGATSSFAVFTASGLFTVVGAATDVTGDVGTNVGSFTGFPPGTLNGLKHVVDATSSQAATDVLTLYDGLTQTGTVIDIGLGNGQILNSGIYQTGGASTLDGNLILDGQNNTNSLFIIRIGGALSTGGGSMVTLTNGASISNVYWQVNGQFDLAASSVFAGIVVVNGAINLLDSAKLFGKALSKAGAINLQNNEINKFTWTGATNTDWNTLGNWIGGIPTILSTVIIPNVSNKPIINNTSILIGNLTIDASSSLTINAGKDLTISDYLINNGTFNINSDATNNGSLIVTGTATGNITYNRYLSSNGATNWHLFSAPVGNQDINSFVTTAGNIATSGVNYSLAPYDNTLIVGSQHGKNGLATGQIR